MNILKKDIYPKKTTLIKEIDQKQKTSSYHYFVSPFFAFMYNKSMRSISRYGAKKLIVKRTNWLLFSYIIHIFLCIWFLKQWKFRMRETNSFTNCIIFNPCGFYAPVKLQQEFVDTKKSLISISIYFYFKVCMFCMYKTENFHWIELFVVVHSSIEWVCIRKDQGRETELNLCLMRFFYVFFSVGEFFISPFYEEQSE